MEDKNVIIFSDENVNFDKNCCFNIQRGHGDYINYMCLKIVLPSLPENIRYKSNVVHRLIEKILIEVAGTTIIEYNSSILKLIDKLYCKNTDAITDNVIYYKIPISDIFGKSFAVAKYKGTYSHAYSGLLINYLEYCSTKLYVKFAKIDDIIENYNSELINEKHIFQNLCLKAELLCHYNFYSQYLCYDKSAIIIQKLTYWINNEMIVENNQHDYVALPININFNDAKNIILSISSTENVISHQDIECFLFYGNKKKDKISLNDPHCNMTKINSLCMDDQLVYHYSLFNRERDVQLVIKNIKQKVKLNCYIEIMDNFIYEGGIYREIIYREKFVFLSENNKYVF
jgi:hypothetical protein